MWKLQLHFIELHYVWISFCGLLGLVVLLPYGNLSAADSWFFGVSASTESGLNTVDIKDMTTYQQLFLYFIPTLTNPGFINAVVVAVRLYWFEKRLKKLGLPLAHPPPPLLPAPSTAPFSTSFQRDVEAQGAPGPTRNYCNDCNHEASRLSSPKGSRHESDQEAEGGSSTNKEGDADTKDAAKDPAKDAAPRIKFLPDPRSNDDAILRIPSPRARDNGAPITELPNDLTSIASDDDAAQPGNSRINTGPSRIGISRRFFRRKLPVLSAARSINTVASSMFVLGATGRADDSRSDTRSITSRRRSLQVDLPALSEQVTVGRNSRFHGLGSRDREILGGIEYCSLKLLFKIVCGYFLGLHVFGMVCLLPWIHNAPTTYTDYLAECGQDRSWWAIYSAQTMVNNLGLTLTPDSMIRFRDATWPMLVMTFLAFAGNTMYPVFLRLAIWVMSKAVPRQSSTHASLRFLLEHPRRCYTLLFPSRPTWILFGVLFILNFVDVLLIMVLDLKNPAVNVLPLGPRLLASIFQAASARHTGTATFSLSEVNPAVQFSLLVMMYVAILPIAISIRASNTYEERTLGIYGDPDDGAGADENDAKTYVSMHLRHQLSFDLWYIFLGTFCICVAEASRIVDVNQPGYSVFSIFFEVVSAYGNVGLSLGHPDVSTSLSGRFSTFSKVVICAMMIRGRHRGLPYSLDRAILLPSERHDNDGRVGDTENKDK